MQVSKRFATVGAALALGTLGATSTATASTATPAHAASGSTKATAPKITYYTPDVAAIAAHLPKGMHVKLIPVQSASTLSPAIATQGCVPNWGVEVTNQTGGCVAYGDAGTAALNYYVTRVFTENNYGLMTFNKDLTQYKNHYFDMCEEWEFNTGKYNTALVQSITIQGWQTGLVCTSIAAITY